MINNTCVNAYTDDEIEIKRVIVMSLCINFISQNICWHLQSASAEYPLLMDRNRSRGNNHLLLPAYQRHRLPLNHIVDIDIRKSINDSHSLRVYDMSRTWSFSDM